MTINQAEFRKRNLHLDLVERLDRIDRMLRWLVVREMDRDGKFMDGNKWRASKFYNALPDLDGIIVAKEDEK